MSKGPKKRTTLSELSALGSAHPLASAKPETKPKPDAQSTDSTINGLDTIERQVRNSLDTALFLPDAKIFPSSFAHDERIIGIAGEYHTDAQDTDLSIDKAALESTISKFMGQLRKDFKPAAVQKYYNYFREHNWQDDYTPDDRPVVNYPPNALALLLVGITEFLSSKMPPSSEEDTKTKITRTVIEGAECYARGVYLGCRKSDGTQELPRLPSDTDIEILAPQEADRKDTITGLDTIERFIQQRLISTGNRKFTGKASLVALKETKTIDADSIAVVPVKSTALVPARRSTGGPNWSIDKTVLEALTDRFAEQLNTDIKDNESLFTPEKVFSPNALSILLYGIEFARQSNNPPDSFTHDLQDILMGSIIGDRIEEEAKHYAECILYGKTAEEVSPQRRSPRRR